jgi:hypothetical protein
MSKEKGITWRELSLDQSTAVKALCEPMPSAAVINSAWMHTNGQLPKVAQPVLELLRVLGSGTVALGPTLADLSASFLQQKLSSAFLARSAAGRGQLQLPTTRIGGRCAWLLFANLRTENRTDI